MDKLCYYFSKKLFSLFLSTLAIVSPSSLPPFFISTLLASKHLIRDEKKSRTAQLMPRAGFPFCKKAIRHPRSCFTLFYCRPYIATKKTFLSYNLVCSCTWFESTILLSSLLSPFLPMKHSLIVCRPFNMHSSQLVMLPFLFPNNISASMRI